MPFSPQQAAVIGAGTMGATIAALLAQTGIHVLLVDLPATALTSDEQAQGLTLSHPRVRNRSATAAISQLQAQKILSPDDAMRIEAGNIEDAASRFPQMDWIIEAIIEKTEAKRALFAHIEPLRRADAIVTTNSSGIPISDLCVGRGDAFRRHFFGAHFFNPPHRMRLLEVIPNTLSDPAILQRFSTFAEDVLQKGVVLAKDTPNFIANRVGIFGMLAALHLANEQDLSVETVDALTNASIGFPTTATFRLFDLIGIDIVLDIADNLSTTASGDERIRLFQQVDLLRRMAARRLRGLKDGAGFYRRIEQDGKRVFEVIERRKLEYSAPQTPSIALPDELRAVESLPLRLHAIVQRAVEQPGDPATDFVATFLANLCAYAACRVPDIAPRVVEIDRAMRWGFNHALGPFQIWQSAGVYQMYKLIRRLSLPLPEWTERCVWQDEPCFYLNEGNHAQCVMIGADGKPGVADFVPDVSEIAYLAQKEN